MKFQFLTYLYVVLKIDNIKYEDLHTLDRNHIMADDLLPQLLCEGASDLQGLRVHLVPRPPLAQGGPGVRVKSDQMTGMHA